MSFNTLWRWLFPAKTKPLPNGSQARRARLEAERRRDEAQRAWPEVVRAHNELAEWFDQALGRDKR